MSHDANLVRGVHKSFASHIIRQKYCTPNGKVTSNGTPLPKLGRFMFAEEAYLRSYESKIHGFMEQILSISHDM